MRTKVTLLLAVLVSAFGFSKAYAQECVELTSLFVEPAKVKNYDEAIKHYDELKNSCASYSLAIYQYAERMFKHFIEEGDHSKMKDLEEVYELRAKHFPDRTNAAEIAESLARLKFDSKIGSTEEWFNDFDKAYKLDPARFTSPVSLYTYFSLAVDLHSEDKKPLPEIFTLYDELIERVGNSRNNTATALTKILEKESEGEALDDTEQRHKKAHETNLTAYGKVIQSINGKLGVLADCENLIPLYEKEYEDRKDDIAWLKAASNRLDAKNCETDLFFKMAQRLHELEPSADSAYYLARMLDQEKKYGEALKYYNQAAELTTNKAREAAIYFRIGEYYRTVNSPAQARTYYLKNLELNPSNGISYLRIGALYAASANSCGTTTFEKRAVYWRAAEMADRAAAVDVSIASNARKTADSYKQMAPSRTDIFNDGMSGQVIPLKCWIGGSITVPTL